MIQEIPFFVNAEIGKMVFPKLPILIHINLAEIKESENLNQSYFFCQSRGFQDYNIFRINLETE